MMSWFVVIALTFIAGSASLSTLPQKHALSEKPAATAEIDFVPLHRQANAALDNLRRTQEHRQPSGEPAAAF